MKKTAMTNDPSVAGTKILQFNTNLPEPFDKAEIEGFNGQQPLIEFVSQSTDWLKLQVQPFLYDNLPVTIGKNNINLTWKTVEENGTKPVAPDAGLQFIQPNKNVVLQVAPNQLGQMPTLNPSQKLRFDLYQIVEDDYKMVVPQLKSALNERYNWYICDTYCGGITSSQCNDPEDCKFCAKKAKTKYNLNSDISAYNFANSALGDALMTVVNSSTYPQPPAAQSTDVNITYRLPGKGGVSTLTSITLGGTGNKPSAGDTKGKSGYVPTQDASRSGNDALKILDFLKLDDKVLNYSDLQTEADDLYAKHGFRTYVISEYYLWKNFTKAAKLEYINDVKKRIQAINTDGTPFIVVNLSLGKDLDFQAYNVWTKSITQSLEQDTLIRNWIISYLEEEKDNKMNIKEASESLIGLNRMLEFGKSPYNYPDDNYDVTNIADVRSARIVELWNDIAKKLVSKSLILDRLKDRNTETKSLYNANVNNPNIDILVKEALKRLKERWENYKQTFTGDANVTYGNLEEKDNLLKLKIDINGLIDLDNQDIIIIKDLSNKSSAINAINEANNNMKIQIVDNIYIMKEEINNQWHRFDNIYSSTESNGLITKLNTNFYSSGVIFTNAWIKAWHAQECWDFTNKKIEGLENKTNGIVTSWVNKYNNLKHPDFRATDYIVGVAQLQKATREDAIKWAKLEIDKGGINTTINDVVNGQDSRKDIQASISTSCAYLGYLMQNQIKVNFAINGISFLPMGKDLKRILLAGFNGGPGKYQNDIIPIVRKRFANKAISKDNIYDWDAIKVNLPDETKNYIPLIESRLKFN